MPKTRPRVKAQRVILNDRENTPLIKLTIGRQVHDLTPHEARILGTNLIRLSGETEVLSVVASGMNLDWKETSRTIATLDRNLSQRRGRCSPRN